MPWTDSGARTGPHEISLIARIAFSGGDDDAARRIYRKYHMMVFRIGLGQLRNKELADDVVQETFIKLCKQAPRYSPSKASVPGWIVMMANSAATDIRRKWASRSSQPVEEFQLPPQPDNIDQVLTALALDEALGKLRPIYADVVKLYRQDLTLSQIAERLGIPPGTVKSRLAKALDTLGKDLASLRGDDDAL